MNFKKYILILLLPLVLFAQDESQTFLSLRQTGVEEFLQKYPEFDGRGTIVLILDSGVDMGVDGLTKTSTGETKVIDVQDFSRQGYIEYVEAEIDDEDDVYYFLNEDKNYKVAGADKLTLKPVDDKYFIGVLEESKFLNSGLRTVDVNENGNENEKFFFVTFKTKDADGEYWVVYLDLNANGDLSDDEPLRNYKEKHQAFYFERPNAVPYVTFALNIYPEKNVVSFFFDDNGHGTHCSGISTGNKIGEADFNGVAPGANIIGLKIGNNEYSGGATVTESMKNAYDYADKLSRELKQPCIINMSYGVGSEIETHAEMEVYLDELALKNPYLYICKSAGNDGPGISTLGQPSASRMCIVTGAALTKEVAGDMHGAIHKDDTIYAFSGRGGEVDKPDVVSPGGCFATIPNFRGWDGMQGTSMASPYTAGVVALLMSGVVAKYPDVKISSYMIQKVLRESAVWMEGYTHLDQGGGMINVMNAWNLLEKYIKTGEVNKMETYSVSAFAPNMPGDKAPALYIRNGSYLTGNERYTYTITRDNTIKQKKFYRVYNLKSDSEWLLPAQKRAHIRNDQRAYVDVKFDRTKMTEPGLYNGKIFAYRQGTDIVEFELMATVVIPYEFSNCNDYELKYNDKQLEPTRSHHYFLNVPAGATSLNVDLTVEEKEYGILNYILFNPDGREVHRSSIMTSYDEENVTSEYNSNIYPGVWELVVNARRTASNTTEYNLKISLEGIDALNGTTISEHHNTLEVVSHFGSPKSIEATGVLKGYQEESAFKISGFEEKEIEFTIAKDEKAISFEVMLSKVDYNKNTDFAFLIYDEKGKRLRSGGLGYQDGTITLNNKDGYENQKFTLKLVPGFVYESDEAMVHLTKKTYFKDEINLNPEVDGNSKFTLYPTIKEDLKVTFNKPENLKKDKKLFGVIYFKNTTSNVVEYELPVIYK